MRSSEKRSLQPLGLLPPCGNAPSIFHPLHKIPHCYLPQDSGPRLSPSVADHPLRPATDHHLGKPFPHQLANQTQTPPEADSSFNSATYGVLATVSSCCPTPKGRFLHMSTTENTTRMPRWLSKMILTQHFCAGC